MSAPKRPLTVAAAQLGPIQLKDTRSSVIARMCTLLDQAAASIPKAQLVVFPELAFTTFFPRYFISDESELRAYFEAETPDAPIEKSPHVKPLFDKAQKLGIDVHVGYAEAWTDPATAEEKRFNSEGSSIAKYRKVHLPGVKEPWPGKNVTQQLEKRYFSHGDMGFPAFRAPGLVKDVLKQEGEEKEVQKEQEGLGDPVLGMLICNDRRWPEAWRAYGLQGVELVLCGYNTTAYAPQLLGSDLSNAKPLSREETAAEVLFHHKLCITSNSYMNSCFSVNVGKVGSEDGHDLIAGTCIVDPKGYVVKESQTKDDELVIATLDLAACRAGKTKTFDLGRHRQSASYGVLVERAGVKEPELLP
ncbi:unnamed protein product [Penicillium glandicola]